MAKDVIEIEGKILESMPNAMFRVEKTGMRFWLIYQEKSERILSEFFRVTE